MKQILPALGVLCACLSPAAAFAAASPFDGTWKTNLSSIDFSKRPDAMVLKDGTYDCTSCTPPYKIKADGAFHAISGHPSVDETSVKVIDARTVEQVDRKGGRVVGRARSTASADGRTLTITWTDTTNPGAPAVDGTVVETRAAPAPSGAHATSGSWIANKAQGVTEAGLTQTYKLDGDMLTMRTGTGQSYTAKLGGAAAPFTGDPNVTTVAVKQVGPRELMETDMHDGKAVFVMHMTVSADGKKMMMKSENKKNNTTSSATADKM